MPEKLFALFAKEIYREISKGQITTIKNFKYYWKWKQSLEPGRNAIADEQAWISFAGISFLNKHVNSNTTVFEYGAGGSTLFFANRAKEVIAVEHHEEWYRKVKDGLNNKEGKNWKLNLIFPEKHEGHLELDPADPADYYTSDETYLDCTFRSYVKYIDRYPENYFDIVLVDGRSRPSCIHHSIPKIKPGGFLVMDNANRQHYFREMQSLRESGFELVFNQRAPSPYLMYFTKTALFRKL